MDTENFMIGVVVGTALFWLTHGLWRFLFTPLPDAYLKKHCSAGERLPDKLEPIELDSWESSVETRLDDYYRRLYNLPERVTALEEWARTVEQTVIGHKVTPSDSPSLVTASPTMGSLSDAAEPESTHRAIWPSSPLGPVTTAGGPAVSNWLSADGEVVSS